MNNKRVQVNVRLKDEEGATLDKLSKMLNLSKSEVVRMALNDDMEKTLRGKVLMNSDDREIITRQVSELINEMSKMNFEINRVGNNINQIAKVLHKDNEKRVFKLEDREKFEQEFFEMTQSFDALRNEVREKWQSLV